MARCLIIGCGCRGLALAAELRARGHVVRGTTRSPERAAEIERSGSESRVGDPDRVSTLGPALEHVSVACILLGSVTGALGAIADLHGSRLQMLLTRMLDTTVHGVVYEAAGSVEGEVLRAGAEHVRTACEDGKIPYVLLRADPADSAAWLEAAANAVDWLLLPGE